MFDIRLTALKHFLLFYHLYSGRAIYARKTKTTMGPCQFVIESIGEKENPNNSIGNGTSLKTILKSKTDRFLMKMKKKTNMEVINNTSR